MGFTVNPDFEAENRVGDFFWISGKCDVSQQPVTPDRIREKSTCDYDSASDVANYGFRFYSPELGRWPNRDPLGDMAFFLSYLQNTRMTKTEFKSLYSQMLFAGYVFVKNDPIAAIDKLGLKFKRFAACAKIPGLTKKVAEEGKNISIKDCQTAATFASKGGKLVDEYHAMVDENFDICVDLERKNNPSGSAAIFGMSRVSTCMWQMGVKDFEKKYEAELKALDKCTCLKSCVKLAKAIKTCLSKNPLK